MFSRQWCSMRGFVSFAVVAFGLLVSPIVKPVLAQEAPALQVATIPLPPWGYKSADGRMQGICFEWAQAIAERMGRKIENHMYPMSRMFKALEHGKVDFSIFLRTPYSEKVAVPVVDVQIPFRTVILPRKGIKVTSFKDLDGVTLSMARGLKVGGEFEEHKELNILQSMDYAHSMKMFAAGRADAIVGTYQSLLYNAYVRNIDIGTTFDEPFELAQLEGWVQASSAFVEREGVEKLQSAAQSLIDDGTFKRIYLKYNRMMLAYY